MRTLGTAAVVVLALAGAPAPARRPANAEPAWQQQSDAALGAGRGVGRQLMTEQEWNAHREKMRSLPPAERERYREEWHKQMMERAAERGITLPSTPGPHGRGRGRGAPGPP